MVEEINGGDNSTNLENTDLDKRAIHIHGGMEHNLVGCANYYSYKNIKISKGSEFTGEIITIEDIFLDIGKQMLETNHTLNLKHLLKIALELKKYLWQKPKLDKTQNLSKATIDKQLGFLTPKVGTIVVSIDNQMVLSKYKLGRIQ